MSEMLSAKMIDVSSLPALPQVLVELVDACGRPDVTVSDVGPIVGRDPALAARILQLANSALFGVRHPITDIGQAVVFLGLDIVRNLAISVSAHEVFRVGKGDSRWMAVFWYRAILAALFCQKLAVRLGYDKPSEAYLAGLLDSIGMLFFYVQMPENYAAMLAEIPRKDWEKELATREVALFGVSHAEIGGILLDKWKLADLAEVIASPSLERLPSKADLLSLLTIARLRLAEADSATLDQSWLDKTALEKLYQEAEASVEELARMMGISVKPPSTATSFVAVPSAVAPPDHGRRRLIKRMRSAARLEGLLVSLLTAPDLPGAYRALEHGMAILLGVEQVVLLLPDRDGLRFRPSRDNLLHQALAGRYWPATDHDSCVARCLGESLTCQISQGQASEAERKILDLFATTALLAIPLPLDMFRRGVVLLGFDEGELAPAQTGQETALLFAAHAGARIRQEEMREQQERMTARLELQVAENIARGILHEIVNPLATVQNAIRIMEDNLATGQNPAATLSVISGESERIGRVARQLRRLAESAREIKLQETDINVLLAETVAHFRGRAPVRRFLEHFDPVLPPFISSPDILKQTLETLLNTAVGAVAADGLITVKSGDLGNGQAMVEIRLSKCDHPGWHGDLLVVQLAHKRLCAIDGRVISREDGRSADGESGWLFRLTVPMMPLTGTQTSFFDC